MTLHSPFCISARLLPALKIGDAFLSLEMKSGAPVFYLDIPGAEEHEITDFTPAKAGRGSYHIPSWFSAMLNFLSAAGESYRYNGNAMRENSNTDLFPEYVCEWACQNCDELSMLALEIEESEVELIES